ncbi:MAG: threonine/serine exporter family protein, partial [Anaerotignum sp.]|nr:threonine/serine exporter family protein [Anaerotignum sp.]
FARILSTQRRLPTIVYHLPGILPLVPGAAVYHCITSAMEGGAMNTTINILTAFKLAGAIGIGSVIILVLPAKWFNIIPRLERKDA